MTRVYADVVGDLFHLGHVEFLRQARALGDFLVVGVHSDPDVATYKRLPILSMSERLGVVAGCRYVDEVLPNAPLCVDRRWLDRHRLDLVAHGNDLDPDLLDRFYHVPLELGILRTVPYTSGISTTEILKRVARRLQDPASGL
ncbi:MAG: adenylyltransferase/cytidyltransferase family protein [Acidimicrobiales bacterium]